MPQTHWGSNRLSNWGTSNDRQIMPLCSLLEERACIERSILWIPKNDGSTSAQIKAQDLVSAWIGDNDVECFLNCQDSEISQMTTYRNLYTDDSSLCFPDALSLHGIKSRLFPKLWSANTSHGGWKRLFAWLTLKCLHLDHTHQTLIQPSCKKAGNAIKVTVLLAWRLTLLMKARPW